MPSASGINPDDERDYFINNPKVAAKSKRAALYTPDEINKLASKRKECPICEHKVKEHSEKSSVFGTKVICDVCDCKTKQKDFFAILDRLYPTEDMINNCGECGHKKKDHYIRASSYRLTKIICNICRCKNDLLESRPSCRRAQIWCREHQIHPAESVSSQNGRETGSVGLSERS